MSTTNLPPRSSWLWIARIRRVPSLSAVADRLESSLWTTIHRREGRPAARCANCGEHIRAGKPRVTVGDRVTCPRVWGCS